MHDAERATRHWLERAVIGLNLCPFAKSVVVKNQVRFVVSDARTPEALQAELADELRLLAAADPEAIDTTLLIHPQVLGDFLDFNDFLDVADATLEDLGLDGTLQIASFHPHYQFAGTAPDDAENLTNRAPYPTLHLLREASIAKAVEAFPEAEAIYERNIETVRGLGLVGWEGVMGGESRFAHGTVPNEVVNVAFERGVSPMAAWREHLGLTQAEVAGRMGITQAA